MKILVPDIVDIPQDLDPRVTVVPYDPRATTLPDAHRDAQALVAWGNSPENLVDAATLPELAWVQALSAGTDAIVKAGFAPHVVITGGSGLHDRTVTEHALALTLSMLRRLPAAADAQRDRVWSREIGGVQPMRPEGAVTTLIGASVLIWGFGNIGQNLAPILTALGADVRGVARSDGERGGYPVVSEARIRDVLPTTDVLIMVLPSTAETDRALNAERLAALPPHAYVVNVGRGSTVDEEALVAALETGSIAGAAIDVAAIEPLPAESPLWGAPRLIITPHAAGGRPDRAPALIAKNLAAFLEGAPLTNPVSRD